LKTFQREKLKKIRIKRERKDKKSEIKREKIRKKIRRERVKEKDLHHQIHQINRDQNLLRKKKMNSTGMF
jgi:hypothetical protein